MIGRSRRRGSAALLLAALLLDTAGPADVTAAELVFSEAARVGERYRVQVEMRLAIPAERALAQLTDYRHLAQLNPAIRVSRVLEQTAERTRVYLETRGCVMFLCRTLRQVQSVRVSPDGQRIEARVEPDSGSFHYGRLVWQLTPESAHTTLISFRAELEPAVWVAPFIGPWAIRNLLQEQTQTTMLNLERAARP